MMEEAMGGIRSPKKYFLQHKLVNPFNLTITVAHCPRGLPNGILSNIASSREVPKNWTGIPLQSFETMLN